MVVWIAIGRSNVSDR